MHKGSCLCGRVSYQYDGDITDVSRCYCTQCQKAQGTAFVAVALIESDKLTFLQGEECLKAFQSTPGKVRVLCSECGSPIYSARDDKPQVKRLRLGTLDTEVRPNHQCHVFVADKPAWYEIHDDYQRFPGPVIPGPGKPQ